MLCLSGINGCNQVCIKLNVCFLEKGIEIRAIGGIVEQKNIR